MRTDRSTTPTRRRTRRPVAGTAALLAALAGVSVLGAACSGGSGDPAGSQPASASPAALARSELLTASDFPSGWKSQGKGSGSESPGFFGGDTSTLVSAMAACIGIDATTVDAHPTVATGPEYDSADGHVTVTDTSVVFPTTAKADTDAEAAASTKAPGCLNQLLGPSIRQAMTDRLGEGALVGQLEVTRHTLPHYGDHDADVTLALPIEAQNVTTIIYIDTVIVQKGRSEASLQLLDTGQRVSSSTLDRLASAAAVRLGS